MADLKSYIQNSAWLKKFFCSPWRLWYTLSKDYVDEQTVCRVFKQSLASRFAPLYCMAYPELASFNNSAVMNFYYGVEEVEFQTEVSFSSDYDITTIKQAVRFFLQDEFSTLPLEALIGVIKEFVLNEQTLPEFVDFLLFIKANLHTDDDLLMFVPFLRQYQSMFAINDLCEISVELAAKGVDFTQMQGLEFANTLLWTEEIMRILAWSDKQDFIFLFLATDVERINYIQVKSTQTKSPQSELESETILLIAKFNVLIAFLTANQIFYQTELQNLKKLLLGGVLNSRTFIRNCIVALEELAELDIVRNTYDISLRSEFLALFSLYINVHCLDPIVAKDIITEFSRLGIIKSESDLYTLTSVRFMNVFDAKFYACPNKVAIFACWFGDPELIALWKKIEPSDFRLQNMQTLLLSAQQKYITLGREALQAIRQDVYDELNSVLLNKQYKESRNLLKLVRAIPKDMQTFYILNSCFDIKNTDEAVLLFNCLPLHIQCICIRENDVTNRYFFPSGTSEILRNLERDINSQKEPLSIYNNKFITLPYDLTISKHVAWLEKVGTPLAYFACGLLLANGGSANPRGLKGQFFLDYQAKRLHDAVSFFNRALKDASLHRNVTVMKMCMFYKNGSASVNQRLLEEEKPMVRRDSVLGDGTAALSEHERISVWRP